MTHVVLSRRGKVFSVPVYEAGSTELALRAGHDCAAPRQVVGQAMRTVITCLGFKMWVLTC